VVCPLFGATAVTVDRRVSVRRKTPAITSPAMTGVQCNGSLPRCSAGEAYKWILAHTVPQALFATPR
jgi:hypothetical protein